MRYLQTHRLAGRLRTVHLWLRWGPPMRGLGLALVLLAAVGAADLSNGAELSFTLLYLAPLGVATWYVSPAVGVAISLASACASTSASVLWRSAPLPAAIAVWNFAVQLGVYLAVTALLAALRRRLEAEGQLARTDPLTGIANRRAFLEMAVLELERARRTGRPITVAYIDLDDFKDVNDRLGHLEGDAILVETATTLRGETRSIDGVARLGGDEFGLLLVDTDPTAAQSLVTRLRRSLAERLDQHPLRVGQSIGVTTFETPPASLDDMLSHADALMYEAKRAGKGQVRFARVNAARLVI